MQKSLYADVEGCQAGEIDATTLQARSRRSCRRTPKRRYSSRAPRFAVPGRHGHHGHAAAGGRAQGRPDEQPLAMHADAYRNPIRNDDSLWPVAFALGLHLLLALLLLSPWFSRGHAKPLRLPGLRRWRLRWWFRQPIFVPPSRPCVMRQSQRSPPKRKPYRHHNLFLSQDHRIRRWRSSRSHRNVYRFRIPSIRTAPARSLFPRKKPCASRKRSAARNRST